jgi:outer membrane protein OmpA-like peptidoglycan-associated protein
MKGFWKFGVVALAATTVAACAGTELQEARKMQPAGSPYNVELSRGYLELSRNEYNEGDYWDSDFFAIRSMDTGKGQNIGPQEIGQRHLPADKVGELTAARQRLVAAQGKNAASVAPSDTARAQVMFDCWMQEQEENRQPWDIKACRDGFMAAMGRVDAALAPKAPAPVAMAPGDYLVFFDWNKANITPEAASILKTVAANAKKMGEPKIVATGHTDTSGSADYNMGLSVRRAEAVKADLVTLGVPAANITTVGKGQEDPLVPTGDGVREPQNRRVQIQFKK